MFLGAYPYPSAPHPGAIGYGFSAKPLPITERGVRPGLGFEITGITGIDHERHVVLHIVGLSKFLIGLRSLKRGFHCLIELAGPGRARIVQTKKNLGSDQWMIMTRLNSSGCGCTP